MSHELQSLADALARRFSRPLLVEDRGQRLLAYTQHPGPVDKVRQQSILAREAAPEVAFHLSRLRLHEAEAPVRTPECPELGMAPRVCAPIRHHDVLLGFLWFIDSDPAMSVAELDVLAEATEDFALAMYRENLTLGLATQRESEAVRDLLMASPKVRADTTRTLIGEGHFSHDGGVVALVCAPVLADGREAGDRLRLAMEHALVEMRRRLGPRQSLHHLRHDHGLLIVEESRDAVGATERHANELHDLLAASTRDMPDVQQLPIGIGRHCEHLEEVGESYEQAREAAHVARHLRLTRPIAGWDRLGIYQALVRLEADDVSGDALHAGLAHLLGAPEHEELVATLETYLDLAGNAQRTAARLFVHRATLYHRLRRIEEIAQTDLRDGEQRLALHLGLKLARLGGHLRRERPNPSSLAG